ncbi:MAG TPA: right-handed parallel beta-helix repeat-containing protein [Chthoniobacteraceae bacterium]|nr:right-handed parallel beta-helix repeat-containing protein [Chthoniobacteraceae bacterium]
MAASNFRFLALVCLTLLSIGSGAAMGDLISGTITQNRTLTGSNTLQGTVVVQAGVVLTIAPGATLLMQAGAALEVRGQLLAEGTQAASILFTREVAGMRWKRITFINAAHSRMKYCTIEYADCAGTHLDYYDNDCNPATPPPARNYHEAVVLLASHVDFIACTFRHLPDSGASAQGDAIAVISDDPTNGGAASAYFDGCQFLSIGQGVHTRFSFVLVENCFFTGHRGDNDDVDMYGESNPPPLIRNNVFANPAHDDMINPTRCSAVIIGNILFGGDDHGIVLRDLCAPIVMNNLIYDCAAACISVQNQCNALLVNNTMANSARGVRFFDHDTRWGPPYCLNPGSGRATLINCIIWNCTNSLTLADSPYTQDRGSHATVIACDIQGGQASATVSANSTLTWGAGNVNVNPQFAAGTYRPVAGAPTIDAGVNPSSIAPALSAIASVDPDGVPRPLDGNGDGTPAYDMGSYEFLLATADSNADGIPDGWTQSHGLNPTDPGVANGNPDGDPFNTLHEWLADTDPTNPQSWFRIESFSLGPPTVSIRFQSSAARRYTLFSTTDLAAQPVVWTPVPGQTNVPGTGGLDTLTDSSFASPREFYRVGVEVP